jgi:hypothetical protein
LKSKIDDNPHGDKPSKLAAPLGCAVITLAMCLLMGFCSVVDKLWPSGPNAERNSNRKVAAFCAEHPSFVLCP